MAMAAGLAAAAAWVVLVASLYVLQRRILFVPDPARPDPATSRAPTMIRVHATTADGLRLEGWWHPPAPRRPVILYCHGNGGNIGGRDDKARLLIGRGYGVLLAGYRGYGGNPGSPSEVGLIADGRAWMDWLAANQGAAGTPLLYGESLGSGVVTALALERPVAGVVLEAPYTSIADIAARRYWFVPVRWLLLDRFDTRSRLPGIHAPLLIVHGAADRVIPAVHGERLFAVAVEPKRLVLFKAGGHNDLFDHGALDVLDGFVRDLVRLPA